MNPQQNSTVQILSLVNQVGSDQLTGRGLMRISDLGASGQTGTIIAAIERVAQKSALLDSQDCLFNTLKLLGLTNWHRRCFSRHVISHATTFLCVQMIMYMYQQIESQLTLKVKLEAHSIMQLRKEYC